VKTKQKGHFFFLQKVPGKKMQKKVDDHKHALKWTFLWNFFCCSECTVKKRSAAEHALKMEIL